MWPAVGWIALGFVIGYGLACLMGACGVETDDAVQAAREAKRKGLHPELN